MGKQNQFPVLLRYVHSAYLYSLFIYWLKIVLDLTVQNKMAVKKYSLFQFLISDNTCNSDDLSAFEVPAILPRNHDCNNY